MLRTSPGSSRASGRTHGGRPTLGGGPPERPTAFRILAVDRYFRVAWALGIAWAIEIAYEATIGPFSLRAFGAVAPWMLTLFAMWGIACWWRVRSVRRLFRDGIRVPALLRNFRRTTHIVNETRQDVSAVVLEFHHHGTYREVEFVAEEGRFLEKRAGSMVMLLIDPVDDDHFLVRDLYERAADDGRRAEAD